LFYISDDSVHMLLFVHVDVTQFEPSVQKIQRDFNEKYIYMESAN